MIRYAPTTVSFTAIATADQYVNLPIDTDRHQLLIHYAAAGNALAIALCAPPLDSNGNLPEPADASNKWVQPVGVAASPTDSVHLIITGRGRYLRLDPGARLGQIVTVRYQPLPPTSA